jgi:hypothetical protein
LWRNPTTGGNSIWEMAAGGGHTTINPGATATSWQIQG